MDFEAALKILLKILKWMNIFTSGIIFTSLVLFKTNLSILDSFACQKYFLYFVLASFFICLEFMGDEKIYSNLLKNTLVPFFFAFSIQTLLLNKEFYSSVKDPSKLLRNIIKKTKKPIVLFIAISICIFLCYLLYYFAKKEFLNYSAAALIVFFSSFSVVYFFLTKRCVPSFKFQKSTFSHFTQTNRVYLVISFLYLIFGAAIIALEVSGEFFKENSKSLIVICLFNLICLLDSILFMKIIYLSNFYYYTLGKTCVGCLYFFLGCRDYYYDESSENAALLRNDESSYRTNSTDDFMFTLYNYIGYPIDEYIIEEFEYFLNITLLSLSKLYKKDLLLHKENNNKFVLLKDRNRNDFKEDEVKVHQNSNFSFHKIKKFKIEIESLFTDQLKEIANIFQLNYKGIASSLISHNFSSLLSKNIKDKMQFKSLKELTLKTYDKQLLIHIYNSDFFDGRFAQFFDKYFTFISQAKAETFIPIIIGAFRVKLDSFKEVSVIITINSLVKDKIDDFYNLWELMRIERKNYKRISSSKDRDKFKVTTDLFFEENTHFTVENSAQFKRIITNDVRFLEGCGCKNFSLLVLYYEYGVANEESKLDFQDSGSINENSSKCTLKSTQTKSIYQRTEKSAKLDQRKFDTQSFSTIDCADEPDKLIKNGFDVLFSNYKGIIYPEFENIFSFNKPSKSYYTTYTENILRYFS